MQHSIRALLPHRTRCGEHQRWPIELRRSVTGTQAERQIPNAVEFTLTQAWLERDGPIDLTRLQRCESRTSKTRRDVGDTVGIEASGLQQLASDLLGRRTTSNDTDIGIDQRPHRALPIAGLTVDLTETVPDDDVEEVLVDSLCEHHHIEVGITNAKHVVWGVRDNVYLSRNQGGCIRRP